MKFKFVAYMNLWPIPKKYWLKTFLIPFWARKYAFDCYEIRILTFVFFVEIWFIN
jgi:hypothetical protein